jgi:hypothetical protein
MKGSRSQLKGETEIGMWQIVSAGIIALIVAGCATQPHIRKTATSETPAAITLFGPPPDSQDNSEQRASFEWSRARREAVLWEKNKNNRETYKRIVKEYPGTDGARRAQWWLDDDKAAFLVSCDIGMRAVRGFIRGAPDVTACAHC